MSSNTTNKFTEDVKLHILGKTRLRRGDAQKFSKRQQRRANNFNKEATYDDILHVQVDATANFTLVLDSTKCNDGANINNYKSAYLGTFPRAIFDAVMLGQYTEFMVRSNAGAEYQTQGAKSTPVGTEVYAKSWSGKHEGNTNDTDDDNDDGLDEGLLKRLIGGFTCTPLAGLTNHYGQENGADASATFHGILPIVSGICVEELRSHMNFLPGFGGLYHEAIATLLTTSVGALDVISDRSLGLKVRASPQCFDNHVHVLPKEDEELCAVTLTLGLSYIAAVRQTADSDNDSSSDSDSEKKKKVLSFSLDQIFLGEHRTRNRKGRSYTLSPYPTGNYLLRANTLADSSVIHTMISEDAGAVDESSASSSWTAGESHAVPLIAGTDFVHSPHSISSRNGVADFSHDLHSSNNIRSVVDLSQEWVSFPAYMVPHLQMTVNENAKIWDIVRYMKASPTGGLVSSGTLQTVVRNGDSACAANVMVHDGYPNFVFVVLHSTKVTLHQGGGAGRANYNGFLATNKTVVHDISPSLSSGVNFDFRDDGTVLLHISTTLPADSSLWVSMDFLPRYQPFETFPADPNRGLDTTPTFASFTKDVCNRKKDLNHQHADNIYPSQKATSLLFPTNGGTMLYARSLIIMPPLPDTTMPFNVLCLSGTLFTFVIGSLMNVLVRKTTASVKRKLTGEDPEKSKVRKLLDNLTNKILGVKKAGNSETSSELEKT